MGMFDNIEVDSRWLPDDLKYRKDLQFQTKSLECGLFNYTIDSEGKLTYFDAVEQPETFVGEIRFYDSIDGKWREFIAWCVNGVVKEVVEVKLRRK